MRFTAWALVLCFLLLSAAPLQAFDMPKEVSEGWHGKVQLGALATFGETDSSAVSGRATLTYSNRRFEHELDTKYYHSSSEALVARRGLDSDVNTPANLESSTRQITGVGYRLYRGKKDLMGAVIGVGHKRRIEVSGNRESQSIGYLGFRFKRSLSEKMSVSLELNSDFGSGSRFSEAEASLSIKLRDPVSLKMRYEVRSDKSLADSFNALNDDLEAALSVSIAVDVF